MFIKLDKPSRQLLPLVNICKGYIVRPCRLDLEVFKGLIGSRPKGNMSHG
jgi:hypothetical protein